MSFFEPSPSRAHQQRPPWLRAPETVLGVPVSVKRVLFRTDAVAIALTDLMAYPSGCQFGLQIAGRRGAMPAERWHELQDVLLGHDRFDTDASPTLSDRILRCGVQFADGSKATNVEHPGWNGPEPSAPSPPVFTESGGGLDGGSTNEVHIDRGFWLWPLPPAEPFTLVVEWPAAGVSLTKTEVDGAAIVTASEAAVPFW